MTTDTHSDSSSASVADHTPEPRNETRDDWSNNRPLAIAGLISFRCRSQYGWIMIGAIGRRDAMREARRSDPKAKRETLQIWNGSQYIDA